MTIYRDLWLLGLAVALPACSSGDLKRNAYATVQNLQQQQCQKAMQDDCRSKQNFDSYQRDRAVVIKP